MMTRDHELEFDEPGAPPGFLLDSKDWRSHEPVRPAPKIGPDDPPNPLARGAGEHDDDGS